MPTFTNAFEYTEISVRSQWQGQFHVKSKMVQRLTRRWCRAFASETGLLLKPLLRHRPLLAAMAPLSTSIAAWSQGSERYTFNFHNYKYAIRLWQILVMSHPESHSLFVASYEKKTSSISLCNWIVGWRNGQDWWLLTSKLPRCSIVAVPVSLEKTVIWVIQFGREFLTELNWISNLLVFWSFKLECFNCTTLERMERRLRTVEESLRNGNGSSFSRVGPTQRAFIRPGRPDMSHVSGSTGPKGYMINSWQALAINHARNFGNVLTRISKQNKNK